MQTLYCYKDKSFGLVWFSWFDQQHDQDIDVNFIWCFVLQIQLAFLMVGHTHDDIDQLFSQIAELLNQSPVCRLMKVSEQDHFSPIRTYHWDRG